MLEQYREVAAAAGAEIERILGSRFLAVAAPVHAPEDVDAVLARIKKEHHGARHHCYAWRMGADGARYRVHEDGEPGGSAGRPILERIDALALTNTLVVVTRYFGGVKLGVGGLVRAYSRAAEAALAAAPVRTVAITRRFRVEHAYELTHAVAGALGAMGLVPARSEYGALVRVVVDVPVGCVERFLRELAERTAARAAVEELERGGGE